MAFGQRLRSSHPLGVLGPRVGRERGVAPALRLCPLFEAASHSFLKAFELAQGRQVQRAETRLKECTPLDAVASMS